MGSNFHLLTLRPRVLMLSGEFPPLAGGVGDYTARVVEALRELGHEVAALTGVLPTGLQDAQPPAWRWVRSWGFGCWRTVEMALEESRADVLHIQYQAGAFGLKGVVHALPLWLRRRRRRPLVVTTFHDLRVPYLFPKAGPLRPLAVRALLWGSDPAIFVDPSDLARVQRWILRAPRGGQAAGRQPWRWIPIGSNVPCAPPPGFDPATTRRELGADEKDLLIGYFGFLSASKGADTLLRALRLLLERGIPARLALVGATAGASNPTDRADEVLALTLARQLGVETRLRASGYLSPADVSAHLLACDVVALPFADGASFRRGSLLAAFEHGRPVVTTTPAPAARGEGRWSLEPDRSFLAVPPGDPLALADALARLRDDPELAGRLAAEARALAARCSWQTIARETARVYEQAWRTTAP